MIKSKKILLIVLIVAAFVLWLAFGIPHHPVAILKVIDSTGKPVVGAVITPDGLRPKKNGGHYMWTDDVSIKPTPVKTDANGNAHVPYPHYVVERLETGEISFRVDHPDFCPDRPFRTVAASPPTNAKLIDRAKFILAVVTRHVEIHPDPVVLQRGGIVKVAGYLDSSQNRITNLFPQISAHWLRGQKDWLTVADGWLSTRRVSEGSNAVRLVYIPTNGLAWFSALQNFDAVAGKTNEFLLQLKPGHRLAGQLDHSIPRPVRNGRVQVEIFSDNIGTNHGCLSWISWRPIAEDGTFSFESLPSGHAEIVALCDGFISTNGPSSRSRGSICIPQKFEIPSPENNCVIGMRPTASCRITVLDDQGNPLPNAEVSFWPNVLWNDWGSTIFMGHLYKSEDLLPQAEINWVALSKQEAKPYNGRTDSKGVVIINNLPPFNQSFAAWATNYEMPVITNGWSDGDRYVQVQLVPGQTTPVTVHLQKKGTDFIHHRQ